MDKLVYAITAAKLILSLLLDTLLDSTLPVSLNWVVNGIGISNIISNLRLFGIYGFGEDQSRVTSCIINAKLKNEPVILNQNVRFHFIWIDDFCKIVKHFVEHSTKEKFLNVAPSESIEIIELAKLAGVKAIVKNEGMNKEYTADNSKLLNELGDFKFTSYNEGMQIFYEQKKGL